MLSLALNLKMKKRGTLEEKPFWWKVVSMSGSVIPCGVSNLQEVVRKSPQQSG